ncbi:MAG: DUF5695 domain-containing protein [Candidatus Aminicenantes bacterium]
MSKNFIPSAGHAVRILSAVALLLFVRPLSPRSGAAGPSAETPVPGVIERGDFRFAVDERGVSVLADPLDPFGASVMPRDAPGGGRGGGAAGPGAGSDLRPPVLGLVLSYRSGDGGDWTTFEERGPEWKASPEDGSVAYVSGGPGAPVKVREEFRTDGRTLDWTIELETTGAEAARVGDLGISFPSAGPYGENPSRIFEHGFLRHQFVSGYGSFFYFVRASGDPPFLLVTTRPGTRLEYADGSGRGAGRFFIHSERTGGAETRGTWRQPHTGLDLAPAGRPESRASYGFRMRWAGSWQELRDILFEEGLFDVRVVPGMTVPEDLAVRFSLRTRARVEAVRAEFPDRTTIRLVGEPEPGLRVYEASFRKLGENMLTVVHDGGRRTFLEFFVTEPMETLIRKRSAFLVSKQQVRDPSKWWDGVFGPYDMEAKVTRTIEDPDIFLDRMVYVLTCDDPGLSKAPFLAAKNVAFPEKREIESIEYYLERFVWGRLQRRDDETPYPYGVYGTPNWFVNRDPARRKAYAESLRDKTTALRDLGKEHVWRSYDYPHVVMLYFHMYEIAKRYPGLSTYLDAAGYLESAWGTARAFFTYPYEIYPSYYETYKWGLYNELVVLDLAAALEREGFPERAAWLRAEWEKKVKYFVYDDRYPFRSEYAFDRTAFESTYAFAKYGATRDMAPDKNLWYDIKLGKWHSHPVVRREDSRHFMDRQLAAGLSVRGWLNPAYYTLGCDPGVSYMAAMGGWGVLDYALHFAPTSFDWLQLGYASYLSSWCLMNTGRPETGYGYWFPGPENDGASGWQFQTAKAGGAWMGSSVPGGLIVPRGPWRYDGEIDLGYGGALRMAATIVTRDPVFGWFAYGGTLEERGEELAVEPRDGLRRRFHALVPNPGLAPEDPLLRLKIEFERDGLAAGKAVVMDKALTRIAFAVENRTSDQHKTGLRLSLPAGSSYELSLEGRAVPLAPTGDWDYPLRAELEITGPSAKVELVKK